jgi:hypothetical protein
MVKSFLGQDFRGFGVINIEQTVTARICIVGTFFAESPMFSGWREELEDARIIPLLEFDTQKLRVHIVLLREVIAEGLRELEHPAEIITGTTEHSAPSRLTEQL